MLGCGGALGMRGVSGEPADARPAGGGRHLAMGCGASVTGTEYRFSDADGGRCGARTTEALPTDSRNRDRPASDHRGRDQRPGGAEPRPARPALRSTHDHSTGRGQSRHRRRTPARPVARRVANPASRSIAAAPMGVSSGLAAGTRTRADRTSTTTGAAIGGWPGGGRPAAGARTDAPADARSDATPIPAGDASRYRGGCADSGRTRRHPADFVARTYRS